MSLVEEGKGEYRFANGHHQPAHPHTRVGTSSMHSPIPMILTVTPLELAAE